MVHGLASRLKSVAASRPAIAARDAAPPIALPGWHWAVQGGHCVRVTGRGCCVCLVCWRSHAHAHAADCAADHPDATKHRGPLARLNMHGRGKGGPLAIPPSTVIWPCVGIIRHLLEVPAREPTRGSAPASGGRNWRWRGVGWGGGGQIPDTRRKFPNTENMPPQVFIWKRTCEAAPHACADYLAGTHSDPFHLQLPSSL